MGSSLRLNFEEEYKRMSASQESFQTFNPQAIERVSTDCPSSILQPTVKESPSDEPQTINAGVTDQLHGLSLQSKMELLPNEEPQTIDRDPADRSSCSSQPPAKRMRTQNPQDLVNVEVGEGRHCLLRISLQACSNLESKVF